MASKRMETIVNKKSAPIATVLLESARRPRLFSLREFWCYLMLPGGFVVLARASDLTTASGVAMILIAIIEMRAAYIDRRVDALVDLLVTTGRDTAPPKTT